MQTVVNKGLEEDVTGNVAIILIIRYYAFCWWSLRTQRFGFA